jgi:hypothetical protein
VAIVTLLAVLSNVGWLGCRDDRPATVEEWKAHRARLDETVWADEILAQEYDRTLVSLWDGLLRAGRSWDPAGKVEVLSSIDFEELMLGTPRRIEELDHGIEVFEFNPPYTTLASNDWAAFLERLAGVGYRLVQSEWRHVRFSPPVGGSPARSQVAVVLHVIDRGHGRRIILEGELAVDWSDRRDGRDHPIAAKIRATGLRMLTRSGPPAFVRIVRFRGPPRGAYPAIHPVLVYDLDKDGLSEIVMVGASRVLRNRGGFDFRQRFLLGNPYALAETMLTETGVIADIDGDVHIPT